MEHRTELQKKHQTILIMAFALIMGCVSFAAVVFFIISSQTAKSSSFFNILRLESWIMGILCLCLSFFIKGQMLEAKRSKNKNLAERLSTYTSATIVAFALCEGPILFGLVVVLMSRHVRDFLLPLLVGGIGFNVHFPRLAQMERYVKKNQA